MAKKSPAFAIDDSLGTAENLTAYAQLLTTVDAQLGAELSRYLSAMATVGSVGTPAIWDALYAATMPAEQKPEVSAAKATGKLQT